MGVRRPENSSLADDACAGECFMRLCLLLSVSLSIAVEGAKMAHDRRSRNIVTNAEGCTSRNTYTEITYTSSNFPCLIFFFTIQVKQSPLAYVIAESKYMIKLLATSNTFQDIFCETVR